MLEDHGVQQGSHDLLLLGVEARDGLERKAQFIIGVSLLMTEQKHIRTYTQRHRQPADHV
jgi:hypothetical protein